MKLIDLLVQELPKRGGWPACCASISQDGDGCVCIWKVHGALCDSGYWSHHSGGGLHQYWSGIHAMPFSEDAGESIITREQYEATLAASKPQWNGEGLPPVGCLVLIHGVQETTNSKFNHSEHCQANLWRNGDMVEVTAIKRGDIAVLWHEKSMTACGVLLKFIRPIKSEADKKRDAAIAAIDLELLLVSNSSKTAEAIYEVIASGKVPGIKLEG